MRVISVSSRSTVAHFKLKHYAASRYTVKQSLDLRSGARHDGKPARAQLGAKQFWIAPNLRAILKFNDVFFAPDTDQHRRASFYIIQRLPFVPPEKLSKARLYFDGVGPHVYQANLTFKKIRIARQYLKFRTLNVQMKIVERRSFAQDFLDCYCANRSHPCRGEGGRPLAIFDDRLAIPSL